MYLGDLLKLSGIVILILGLALRLRTTLVVVIAALVTGLAAGLPLFSSEGIFQAIPIVTKPGQEGIINMLGRAFTEYRYMTLFIITLPAIGLAERFGLQEQSAVFIHRIAAATVGRLQIVFQLFRVLIGILGLRVNGHAAFVRPLIFPMALGAAEAKIGTNSVSEVHPDLVDKIKAASAASENYGNFYGQNLNPVQAGILLVASTLNGLGLAVSTFEVMIFAIPVAVLSIVLGAIQFSLFDRLIQKSETNNL